LWAWRNENCSPNKGIGLMSALNSVNDEMQRLKFLMIDNDTRQSLAAFEPYLRNLLPPILDEFYSHLKNYPDMIKLFSNESRIAHAKAAQLNHWIKLFSGRFDADYFASVKKIGLTLAIYQLGGRLLTSRNGM
jgi:hypothetical protein